MSRAIAAVTTLKGEAGAYLPRIARLKRGLAGSVRRPSQAVASIPPTKALGSKVGAE